MEKVISKILFLMDGSDAALNSANYTLSLAQTHSAIIIAVNVIDPTIVSQLARFQKDITIGEIEIELEENGWKYLYYFEEMALEHKVKNFIILEHGPVPDRVISLARKYEVDLIVLPRSSDRGGTKGVIAGKQLEQIIEYAPCYVLISNSK